MVGYQYQWLFVMQFLAMTILFIVAPPTIVRVLFLIPVRFWGSLLGREYLPVLARVLFLIPVSFRVLPFWGMGGINRFTHVTHVTLGGPCVTM